MGENIIYFVYCHTNIKNNKKYFGITCREPIKRWGHNGCNYKSSQHFYSAIQKYGWNNFIHEVMFTFNNKEEAEAMERELIIKFKTYIPDFGYNIELGGNYKGKHSKDTCKKISDSKIGKPRDEYTRQKVSNSLKGLLVGSKNKRSKKVICIDNGKIYDSMNLAARDNNIDQGDISKCCFGKIKQIKGTHWAYYEDYLKGGDN